MRRGKKGISPAALITLAAALVLLTAVASYLAYANTLKIHESLRKNLRVEEEMRREPKVSLTQGLPPGISPKAYVVIHEMSGYQEGIYDLVYDDNRSNVRHIRPYIGLDVGDCIILTPFYLESVGLPVLYNSYNGTSLTLHSSKAVAKVVPRELKPDEIYPCTRWGDGDPQYPILLHVALDGNICNTQECRNLLTPPAGPSAYVRDIYTIFNITAAPTARIDNVDYIFIGWLVHIYPMQVNPGTAYTMNPLPLWVDSAYDVVAAYASAGSDGSWNWDWNNNCVRTPEGFDCTY